MSPIREKFVNVIDTYGVDDLSENDKECIRSLIGKKI